jgi:bifunctional NMN adenylyltransferase/nudix hydrolase
MTTKKYDTIVYIGRFQPFHNGHFEVLKRAAEMANKIIVLIGSSFSPRNVYNPFSKAERSEMIVRVAISERIEQQLTYFYLHDYLYSNNNWINQVQDIVAKATNPGDKIGLIGHEKGHTTRYLKWFPQWDLIQFNEIDLQGLDATTIREILYEGHNIDFIKSVVPSQVFNFINYFRSTEELETLREEYFFIKKYKDSWKAAPYPPIFVTVDAVVYQDGHVLLVKRKASPGKGLNALPGGFVNQDESLIDAALRELKEETQIKVPPAILISSIKDSHIFDNPTRSLRGRTITNAYFIELPSCGKLPQVKGNDDAEKAFWVPIASIQEETLFEDHFSIINHFI